MQFLAVFAHLRRETAKFHVLLRTWTQDNNLLTDLDSRILNSTPEKCTNVWQIERRGIREINIETACKVTFLRDVSFADFVLKLPNVSGNSQLKKTETTTPTPQYVSQGPYARVQTHCNASESRPFWSEFWLVSIKSIIGIRSSWIANLRSILRKLISA